MRLLSKGFGLRSLTLLASLTLGGVAAAEPPLLSEAPGARVAATATDEEGLRQQLRAVPEVTLTREGLKRLATAPPAARDGKHALDTFLRSEGRELPTLPFDFGPACLSEAGHARTLDAYSRKLRPALRHGGVMERAAFLLNFDFVRPETVATREQMLIGQDRDWRLALVQQLTVTPGPEASRALANRAVFDLSPEVRSAATTALRGRPRTEYAETLVKAFRYPWAPAADHAAQAVAALKAHEVRDALEKLLDLPDPNAPAKRTVNGAEALVVPELVRVNDLKNCLLCHQRSAGNEGTVLGTVPDWDQPISPYDDPSGSLRVRADVVYLRQDFSVIQLVEQPRLWPREQRFDYFLRARRLTEQEAAAFRSSPGNRDYPQRAAVRLALGSLAGTSTK